MYLHLHIFRARMAGWEGILLMILLHLAPRVQEGHKLLFFQQRYFEFTKKNSSLNAFVSWFMMRIDKMNIF